jgi:hypothetical protein
MFYAIMMFILGFAISLSQLCDNVIFLDAQRKQLNGNFENWWNKVKSYNKHRLALLFTKQVSEILDSIFGKNLISKKLVFRSSAISTGLLLITLSVLNISKKEALGVAPWNTYQEGIHQILSTVSALASPTNYATYPVFSLQAARELNNSTNQIMFKYNTNDFLIIRDTNGIFERIDSDEFNHGQITLYARKIYKTDSSDTNSTGTNAVQMMNSLVNELNGLHEAVKVYSSQKYVVLYSVIFYAIMFILNAFLFTLSMVFCKVTIREMSRSGGIISILSLFFTNAFFVIVISGVLMVVMTFISVPLFWLAYPLLKAASSDSLILLVSFLFLSGLCLLMVIGASTKLVILTSLIPSLFAGLIGILSALTVKYRNVFHFLTKNILIRLSQKNPFVFVAGILLFIAAIITLLNEFFSIMVKH